MFSTLTEPGLLHPASHRVDVQISFPSSTLRPCLWKPKQLDFLLCFALLETLVGGPGHGFLLLSLWAKESDSLSGHFSFSFCSADISAASIAPPTTHVRPLAVSPRYHPPAWKQAQVAQLLHLLPNPSRALVTGIVASSSRPARGGGDLALEQYLSFLQQSPGHIEFGEPLPSTRRSRKWHTAYLKRRLRPTSLPTKLKCTVSIQTILKVQDLTCIQVTRSRPIMALPNR